MVIEALISPYKVERNVFWAIPLGFLLSVVGLVVGLILFPKDASLVGILFTTVAGVPFLRNILIIEEIEDEKVHAIIQFFLRNKTIISIYFMFFFGITLSYITLYYILPADMVALLFSKQLSLFPGARPVGMFTNAGSNLFYLIVNNNIKIALIALALSFIYGAGAIMILTWNASALAIFLVSLRSLRAVAFTIPHALFEFGGFFIAAVAGGIISVAIEKHYKEDKETFKMVITDGLLLFILSVLVILIAAAIEVTIGVLA